MALADERKDTANYYAFLLICRKAFLMPESTMFGSDVSFTRAYYSRKVHSILPEV
jgi:hypothetical protein